MTTIEPTPEIAELQAAAIAAQRAAAEAQRAYADATALVASKLHERAALRNRLSIAMELLSETGEAASFAAEAARQLVHYRETGEPLAHRRFTANAQEALHQRTMAEALPAVVADVKRQVGEAENALRKLAADVGIDVGAVARTIEATAQPDVDPRTYTFVQRGLYAWQ